MATPDPPEGLRLRLREARRGKGLLQREVADALGVSRRAVHEWESGARRPHSKLPEIATLYDVSTSWLLTGAEEASVEVRELRLVIDEFHTYLDGRMNALEEKLVTLAELTESVFQGYEELLRMSNLDPPVRRSEVGPGPKRPSGGAPAARARS